MKALITIDVRRLQLFLCLVWQPCAGAKGKRELISIREAWRVSRVVVLDQPKQKQEFNSEDDHLF